jgi:hypothetical protein
VPRVRRSGRGALSPLVEDSQSTTYVVRSGELVHWFARGSGHVIWTRRGGNKSTRFVSFGAASLKGYPDQRLVWKSISSRRLLFRAVSWEVPYTYCMVPDVFSPLSRSVGPHSPYTNNSFVVVSGVSAAVAFVLAKIFRLSRSQR